jgi:hypothetical protein
VASTAAVAAAFGVSGEQAERDRMISFILAAISNRWADQLTFIGGTALARTNLPDGRLSEDIDLITRTSRSTIARQLDRELPDAFRRELGRLHWDPALSAVGDAGEAYLRRDDGLSVKIQLISQIGHPDWPTQRTQLDQRYDDAPPAALDVLTTPAFVAAKTAAWQDRRAPRDLWDLWALNARGAIDSNAAELFRKLGPTGRTPDPAWFATAPSESDWTDALASQTILTITASEAAQQIRDAWIPFRRN